MQLYEASDPMLVVQDTKKCICQKLMKKMFHSPPKKNEKFSLKSFLFKNNFIYAFIFCCSGSLLLCSPSLVEESRQYSLVASLQCEFFSSCRKWGPLCCCKTWALGCKVSVIVASRL